MDKRMHAIVKYIEAGRGLIDVGTDHGYLPVWMAKYGYKGNIIASDINRGPLKKAIDTAEAAGLSHRIDFRQSDGLVDCKPDSVDTIIIAGMGGELICRILDMAEWCMDRRYKLILQPIVENSLLYGMDGLDHTLRIRVAAWRRGEKLILTVTDNGVGMDKAALAALREQIIHGRRPKAEANYRSTGIGLHNIGARLRLYAGSSSCIRVQSKPGFGTRVTLELPWRAIEPQ